MVKKARRKAPPPAQSKKAFELPGKPEWYYFGFFALATILIFHEPLLSPSKLLYGTDLLAGNIFFRQFVTDYLAEHWTWPLWDPYIHGGMPFIDGMHGDIFYPVTLVFYFVFGIFYAWVLTIALHVFAAGVFMYWFLRNWGIRRSVAFLFGLTYLLMPLFISQAYGGHNGKMFVIAYAPLVFLLTDRALNSGKLLYYLTLSVVMFLVMVTPHMQLAYFLFFSLAIYALVRIYGQFREGDSKATRSAVLFVASALLGVAISLVQFLSPFVYLKDNSMRNLRAEEGQGYEYSASWSLHAEEAAAFLVPEFCGDNVQGQPTSYWGRNYFKLNSEHFGIIPIFAAVLGIGLWRRRSKWFFVGTAIVTFLFALGADTFFFRLFYLIPGISSFRAPSLISFVTAFCVITLGAMGMEAFLSWSKEDERFKRVWSVFKIVCIAYSAVAVLILILGTQFFEIWFSLFGHTPDARKMQALQAGLTSVNFGLIVSLAGVWGLFVLLHMTRGGKLKEKWMTVALAGFTFLYMWSFNARYIQTIDPEPEYRSTALTQFLKTETDQEPGRVLAMPQTLRDWYLAYHGIEELSFSMIHGNHLVTFERLTGNDGRMPGLVHQSVQDLLNTRYIVSAGQLPPQYFSPERFRQVRQFAEGIVFENLTALPRAFPMYRYVVEEDPDRIIAKLHGSEFDYRSTIVLEEEPPEPFRQSGPIPDSLARPVVAARVFDRENASFKVEVDMIDDGFLFVSENYYGPWQAFEGDSLLTTMRANLTFRAIPLKRGKHTIECRFENPVYDWASRISLIALLATLAGMVVLGIREKRQHED